MKNKIKIMNKKATSFSGWTEIMILLALFVIGFGLIVSSMNLKYNKNYDSSFGMGWQQDANASISAFENYQTNFANSVNSGTASFTSVFGLVLSTSYDILFSTIKLLWLLISGGWIVNAVAMMHLPAELGLVFQLLYLISVGYALLQVLFRTKV